MNNQFENDLASVGAFSRFFFSHERPGKYIRLFGRRLGKYTTKNWYLSPLLYSFGGLERFLLVRVESKKVGKLHLWEAEKVEPTVVLSLLRLPNLWLLFLCIIATTRIFLSLSLCRQLGWHLCQYYSLNGFIDS